MDRVGKKFKGFTLLELIVTIAIIGVLIAVLVPNIAGQVRDAKLTDANDKAQSVYNATQEFLTTLQLRNEDPKAYFGYDSTKNTGYISIKESEPNGAIAYEYTNISAMVLSESGVKEVVAKDTSGNSHTIPLSIIAANEISRYLSPDFKGSWYVEIYPNTYTVKLAVYCGQPADGTDDGGPYNWSAVKKVAENPYISSTGGKDNGDRDQIYYNAKNSVDKGVGQYPISSDLK